MDAVNIYYRNYLAEIGGIDTVTYNIAYKYSKKKDILFLIGDGDIKQLKRLSKIARVEQYDPRKTYRCKKLFITYETEVPKNIVAEKYARVSHGDLFAITEKGWHPVKDEKITEDYGVSENTCKSAEWYFGRPCTLCPNPIIYEEARPLLKIVSPQRMTWEKGKSRIREMSRQLDEHDIPYQWLIICNRKEDVLELDNPNLIWVKSRLDIKPFIKDADYLALLSDCEGQPMSPQEALVLGTPVIVTDLPCYKDFKLNDKNSFIIKKDLSNLDVEEIYKKKGTFNFKWTPPNDIWGDILEDGKVEHKETKSMKFYKVKANIKWLEGGGIPCADLNRVPQPGETWIVTEARAKELVTKGRTSIVEEIEEPKEEKPIEEIPIEKPAKKKKKA